MGRGGKGRDGKRKGRDDGVKEPEKKGGGGNEGGIMKSDEAVAVGVFELFGKP